jgi:cobalt-zinc-cadmium resistance protein CzcA
VLKYLVSWSIRNSRLVTVLLVVLLLLGIKAGQTLPVDAMPDTSTIQVNVLTTAPGLAPTEVERSITMPIEVALNGTPGAIKQRSISRSGLSSVTVIFKDSMDVWFARQLVLERLRGVSLPPNADPPELAPVSTGLGEIYQFTLESDRHSPMQLRTMLDWDIVPRIRAVPGVIEVNTIGGELKQFQVVLDRLRLESRGLSVKDVADALRSANLNVGAGYIERQKESYTVRGSGLLRDVTDIENVVVRTEAESTPVLVKHLAEVRVAPALRYGLVTREGKGEAVAGIVMMLLGANSRTVVTDVAARVKEIQKDLPPGVNFRVFYDRADFVGRTLSTVAKNLLEGILIVAGVLWLLLGSWRAAIAVVLGIPASMSVALFGMHLFGITGDLMSLGAIDFGFLVDGPIVIVEAVMAFAAGRELRGQSKARIYERVAGAVARPVAFAVAIIMLVYLPLLSLEGVEGKMFRPMAITMASALFGALVYSILLFPAVVTVLVSPPKEEGPVWLNRLASWYGRRIPWTLKNRKLLLALSFVALSAVGWLFSRSGAEFVPRIFEGDLVVGIRRAPSIALSEAKELDLEAEQVLKTIPEIITVVGQTGRAEVAVDPVGNDKTDIVARLKPMGEWTTANSFESLSNYIKTAVQNHVPGTFVSISQPIEDRTNEIISGSRADVQIQLQGPSLEELVARSQQIGQVIKDVPGTGDVRVEHILGGPTITAKPDRARMARHGVRLQDAFDVLQASGEGIKVGELFEAERRFDLRVLLPPHDRSARAIGDLFLHTSENVGVPLREVLSLSEGEGPIAVRRQDRIRAARVDVNIRGRDLVSWVSDARARVAREVPLSTGYTLEWGGQFENFERAQKRLAVVIPVVIAIIFGMLIWMFQEIRFAMSVFVLVPLTLIGGMIGLLLSGLPFSLPATVGFIALGGIGVLNGVVVANAVRLRLDEGLALDRSICEGTSHSLRAVLTTATVAALGFLPMATATSAGAEVQRPLARVVVVGMLLGTVLTLVVLPGILRIMLRSYRPKEDVDEVANEG